MKTSLVILAAGIGSRYGKGIKQLEKVGPGGEIIMDYSIHDALAAGFDRVVFITRHDLYDEFRAVIGDRIEKVCPVAYAFQEKEDLPAGYVCPPERTKPWGTAHALLACRGIVNEPFLVINADDYYGKECFRLAHEFLVSHEGRENEFCMPGFILKNTLSDNGTVTRGICRVENGYLAGVTETGGLCRDGAGAAVEKDGVRTPVDPDSVVSMNMWALTPGFIDALAEGFPAFLDGPAKESIKAEYMLPTEVDRMIKKGRATVRVLTTHDRWFGVTYHEDKAAVVESFRALHAAGEYTEPLYK